VSLTSFNNNCSETLDILSGVHHQQWLRSYRTRALAERIAYLCQVQIVEKITYLLWFWQFIYLWVPLSASGTHPSNVAPSAEWERNILGLPALLQLKSFKVSDLRYPADFQKLIAISLSTVISLVKFSWRSHQ